MIACKINVNHYLLLDSCMVQPQLSKRIWWGAIQLYTLEGTVKIQSKRMIPDWESSESEQKACT